MLSVNISNLLQVRRLCGPLAPLTNLKYNPMSSFHLSLKYITYQCDGFGDENLKKEETIKEEESRYMLKTEMPQMSDLAAAWRYS